MPSVSKPRWQISDLAIELDKADTLLEAAVSLVSHRLKLKDSDVEKPVI